MRHQHSVDSHEKAELSQAKEAAHPLQREPNHDCGQATRPEDLGKCRVTADDVLQVEAGQHSCIHFTWMDLQHNAMVLKRGLRDGRLHPRVCEVIVNAMEQYTMLQRERLACLVYKYRVQVQNKRMEQNLISSGETSLIVSRVRNNLYNHRMEWTSTWSRRLRVLGAERRRNASFLTGCLSVVETHSGLFLRKPLLSRPDRSLRFKPGKEYQTHLVSSTRAPLMCQHNNKPATDGYASKSNTKDAQRSKSINVTGSSACQATDSTNWWPSRAPVPPVFADDKERSAPTTCGNLPRIQQMDRCRVAIGHQNVSSRLPDINKPTERRPRVLSHTVYLRSYFPVMSSTAASNNTQHSDAPSNKDLPSIQIPSPAVMKTSE
uniref:Uncharacterized protein LOC116942009 n=1 Tax=Petromyzon marinus TaxID=7757 RepID=A0AAJ7T311_PETMA|nr:uncharacterized protein LOC116942009 [Petromyzon marinus]XP_032809402.1 uncharacterized protein LOC116942009 [Petromyzon marinus]